MTSTYDPSKKRRHLWLPVAGRTWCGSLAENGANASTDPDEMTCGLCRRHYNRRIAQAKANAQGASRG